MKRLTKRALAILVALGLCPVLLTVQGATNHTADWPEASIVKDETVFARLSSTGGAGQVQVISRLEVPWAGKYIDALGGGSVVNLTDATKPLLSGGQVTWPLAENPTGFYYQTTIDAALPISVAISYQLDGRAIYPEALAGKNGLVTLTLGLSPNLGCKAAYRNGLMTQVQVPLDLDRCHNISAPGASTVIIGRTMTASYLAPASGPSTFSLTFDARDMAMDEITILLLRQTLDLSGLGPDLSLGLGPLAINATTLSEGMAALAEDTAPTKTTYAKIVSGTDSLSTSLADADSATQSFDQDLQAFAATLKQLSALATGLETTILGQRDFGLGLMGQMYAELPADKKEQFAADYERCRENWNTITDNLGTLTTGLDDLNTLLTDPETGLLITSTTNAETLSHLAETTATLAQTASDLTDNIDALCDGVTSDSQSMETLLTGMLALVDNLSDAPLPHTTGELTSFIQNAAAPRSQQFVLRTQAFGLAPIDPPPPQATTTTFWQRLTALFRF